MGREASIHKLRKFEGGTAAYTWHIVCEVMGMRRLLPILPVALLAIGCASSTEENGASDEALSSTTLTAAGCKTPAVTTKAESGSNGPIAGSALTTLNGCIVGKTGETGTQTSARLATILNDTNRIGQVVGEDGSKVFSSFSPHTPTGTLATGLVQDVDVSLNGFGSPSATLRVTRKVAADGSYSVHIVNITAFKASVFFVPVTAIDPNNLTLDVQSSPAANGITVIGTGAVILDVQQDQASQASTIVGDLFSWLTGELNK